MKYVFWLFQSCVISIILVQLIFYFSIRSAVSYAQSRCVRLCGYNSAIDAYKACHNFAVISAYLVLALRQSFFVVEGVGDVWTRFLHMFFSLSPVTVKAETFFFFYSSDNRIMTTASIGTTWD